MIKFYVKISLFELWQCLICTDVALNWFHNSTGLAACF